MLIPIHKKVFNVRFLIIPVTLLLLAGCATTPDPQVAQLQQQVSTLQVQVDTIIKNLDYTHRVAVGANKKAVVADKKAVQANKDVKETKQAVVDADQNAEQAKTAVKTLIEQLPLPPARPVYRVQE